MQLTRSRMFVALLAPLLLACALHPAAAASFTASTTRTAVLGASKWFPGDLASWGGATGLINAPVQIGASSAWTQIAVGPRSAYGLQAGTLWCWGDRDDARLGLGNYTTARKLPTQVGTLKSGSSDLRVGRRT